MTRSTIAALVALCTFATAGADSALAEGRGFRGGGFHGRGFHGRGFHGTGFGGYGFVAGYGYGSYDGYNNWYGISSGHDECPIFNQRVMTRDGWRVRMIPIC
jgi:hypothetical protein